MKLFGVWAFLFGEILFCVKWNASQISVLVGAGALLVFSVLPVLENVLLTWAPFFSKMLIQLSTNLIKSIQIFLSLGFFFILLRMYFFALSSVSDAI